MAKAHRKAQAQVREAIRLLEASTFPASDELVHTVRKRIKKARALVPILRESLGKKRTLKVDHSLRDAARPLSESRDAAALLKILDELEERFLGFVPSEAFASARANLLESAAEISRKVLDEDSSFETTTKLLRSADRRLDRWEIDDTQARPLTAIERSYRRTRNADKIARKDPSSENLHTLRKRAKALRTQLGLLGDGPANPTGRLRLRLGLLARELGERHDLDNLRAVLEKSQAAEPILKVIDWRRIDLQRGSLQRSAVIFRIRPRAFGKSLRRKSRPINDD